MNKIFVYGTLKVGGRFADQFDSLRKGCENAFLKGGLYSVHGSFPAMLLDGDVKIKGELHTFSEEEMPAILERMDRIEGYGGPGNEFNLYNRVEVTVVTEAGAEEKAIAYEFARSVEGLEEVVNGEWPI